MAICLTAAFFLACIGYFWAENMAGTPYQVTTSKYTDEMEASVDVEENEPVWPVSLLPGERINLNTAPSKDLARLPQIGDKRAEDIVAWREEHGAFRSVEELMEVSGIGEGIFAQVEEYITVDSIK